MMKISTEAAHLQALLYKHWWMSKLGISIFPTNNRYDNIHLGKSTIFYFTTKVICEIHSSLLGNSVGKALICIVFTNFHITLMYINYINPQYNPVRYIILVRCCNSSFTGKDTKIWDDKLSVKSDSSHKCQKYAAQAQVLKHRTLFTIKHLSLFLYSIIRCLYWILF